MASAEERKANLDLLLQLLPQMCQDLDAAFQGYSGGVGKTLFLIFLDTIDKCIDAIAALFELLPTRAQYQIKSSFVSVHQAAVIIWDVFCENPLQQASVIKGTLRLCIDKMPNMVRRVERVINECIVDKPLSEHTFELLDQCSTCLMSKPMEKKAQKNTPKSEIATHSDKSDNIIGVERADDAKASLLNSMKGTEGDENKVLVPSKESSDKEMATEEKSKRSLDSEVRRARNN
mmetsp:Transcript_30281/g.64146  ORF Transcript_30281/g.64146 Transcript_30281/m.64146 type:complete len:233 (+) Transcript_30281:537-1235(+)